MEKLKYFLQTEISFDLGTKLRIDSATAPENGKQAEKVKQFNC